MKLSKRTFRLSFVMLALVLALACILTFPTEANAASVSDLTYTVSNGSVTITDCKTSASGELTIPSTIDGFKVTAIGYKAFADCTALTKSVIPDSVTSMGSSAFSGCTRLSSVTFGKGLTTISDSAFSGCTALTSVSIPNNITKISDSAFYGCTVSKEIKIPATKYYLKTKKQTKILSLLSHPRHPSTLILKRNSLYGHPRTKLPLSVILMLNYLTGHPRGVTSVTAHRGSTNQCASTQTIKPSSLHSVQPNGQGARSQKNV